MRSGNNGWHQYGEEGFRIFMSPLVNTGAILVHKNNSKTLYFYSAIHFRMNLHVLTLI